MTGPKPSLWEEFQAQQNQPSLWEEFQYEQARFKTARGRAGEEFESKRKLVEQVKKNLEDPNITPERRATLLRLLKEHDPEGEGLLADSVGEGVKRFAGGVAGALPAMFMSAADLALYGAEHLPLVGDLARTGREQIAEGQAALQELTGAEGIEGFAGNLVGGFGAAGVGSKLASSSIPAIARAGKYLTSPYEFYARPARATLKAVSKVPGLKTAASKALTGNVVQRVAGQAIADLPVNVLQAQSIPYATSEEKLKAFLIQTGASGIGGVLPVRKGSDPVVDVEAPKTISVDNQSPEVAEVLAKVQGIEQKKAWQKQARVEAKTAWENANEGKSWTDDLSKNDRAKLIKERFAVLSGQPAEATAPTETVTNLQKFTKHSTANELHQALREAGLLSESEFTKLSLSDQELYAARAQEIERQLEEALLGKDTAATYAKASNVAGSMNPEKASAAMQVVGAIEDGLNPLQQAVLFGRKEVFGDLALHEWANEQLALSRNKGVSRTTDPINNEVAKYLKQLSVEDLVELKPWQKYDIGGVPRQIDEIAIADEAAQRLKVERVNRLDAEISELPYQPELTNAQTVKLRQIIQQRLNRHTKIVQQLPHVDLEQLNAKEIESLFFEAIGAKPDAPAVVMIGDNPHRLDFDKYVKRIQDVIQDPRTDPQTEKVLVHELELIQKRETRKAEIAQRVDDVKKGVEKPDDFVRVSHERPKGVGPEEPSTTRVFQRVKDLDLGKTVRLMAASTDYGVTESNVVAELSARDALAAYDIARGEGLDHVAAREKVIKTAENAHARFLAKDKPPVVKPELETVETKKQLADMEPAEIDDLKDAVDEILFNAPTNSLEYKAALRDMETLAKSSRPRPAQPVPEKADPRKGLKVRLDSERDYTLSTFTKKVAVEAPLDVGKLLRTPVEQIESPLLERLRNELRARIAGMGPEGDAYRQRISQINETLAKRADPPRTDGVTLNMPAQVVGGAAGVFIGLNTGDTQEERYRNAALFGLAGAFGAAAIKQRFVQSRSSTRKLLPGEAHFAERVVETGGGRSKDKRSIYQRLSDAYYHHVRPEGGAERDEMILTGGRQIPANFSFAKAASNFGSSIAQADQFILGTPYIIMRDGTRVVLDNVKNLGDIVKLGGGELEPIGRLAVAMHSLERYAAEKPIPGIDLVQARILAASAPKEMHQAVRDLRNWFKAGLLQARESGLISEETYAKSSAEEFYTAIQYVFGEKVGERGPVVGSLKQKQGPEVGSPQPIKKRSARGLPDKIQNPVESALKMMPRLLKAAELQRAKLLLLEVAQTADPEARYQVIRPAPRNPAVDDPTVGARAAELAQRLKMDPGEAIAITHTLSEDINALSPSLTVYRNGKLQSWRIEPSLANTFMNLTGQEQGMLADLLTNGKLSPLVKVTNFARKGIVLNPIFVAYQSFRDQWQATMNSEYGFVWGYDSLRAWAEMMSQGDRWKEYVRYGGGDPRYYAREALSVKEGLKSFETASKTLWGTAAKQIMEMHPIDAYKTLVTPMFEAARFGEFLRARGAGAAPLEAAYAAKRVVGNFQRTATGIKALSKLALFLNPALRAMDESWYSSGLHPFRPAPNRKGFQFGPIRTSGKTIKAGVTLLEETFGRKLPGLEGRLSAGLNYAIKGFAGITMVSYLMHAAFGDDEEIQELRRAPGGTRYWWMKVNDHIIKIPKPILEGQMFGTTLETALDSFHEKDPDAWKRWAEAVRDDAAVNLLPLVAAVPMSIWGNRDYTYGGPILPGNIEGIDPQFATRPETTIPARIVGKAVSPLADKLHSETARRALSPAGIDYIARQFGGRVLQESLVALTQAIEYVNADYLHPAYELPFARQALAHYPASNSASIDDFYRQAEKVDEVARTLKFLASNDVDEYVKYLSSHITEAQQIKIVTKSRERLADLWRSRDMIRRNQSFSMAEKRDLSEFMTRTAIETAQHAMLALRSIK